MVGVEKANRVWRRSAGAVEEIVGLIADNGINCGFERKQTLFLAGEACGSRALRTEVDARARPGIAAKFVDGSTLRETRGIDRTGAIESAIGF
jgi:hypothetical protein